MFRIGDRFHLSGSGEYHIVECKVCRLIRLEPRAAPGAPLHEAVGHEELLQAADQAAPESMEWRYRRLILRDRAAFLGEAFKNAGKQGYVLEVGCGMGSLLGMLPDCPAVGIERHPSIAGRAWRRHGVPVFCADLAEVPLLWESCSVVAMFNVLPAFTEPVRCLNVARRLLAPNGRLVLQLPNASSWQFMLLGEKWSSLDAPRSRFHYRERDIESLLDFCGFEIVRTKHFSLDNALELASSVVPETDPVVRRVCRVVESETLRVLKNAIYFGVILAAMPVTMLGAACGAGSTITLEARKKQ